MLDPTFLLRQAKRTPVWVVSLSDYFKIEEATEASGVWVAPSHWSLGSLSTLDS